MIKSTRKNYTVMHAIHLAVPVPSTGVPNPNPEAEDPHRTGPVRNWVTQQEASLNIMHLNHPETTPSTQPPPPSGDQLSSVKPVLGDRNLGTTVLADEGMVAPSSPLLYFLLSS